MEIALMILGVLVFTLLIVVIHLGDQIVKQLRTLNGRLEWVADRMNRWVG